ncbi:diaminopimelate epimerase [Pseudaestuariivita atlantica]|uniref:Diaminopimelate epimerase n=1 Tax=Pseudaestuariivita atlantica TaxID=1317121 RepID=A0A0L1JT26_9RHOB|nr:diaminopimelate epimerase [Pseudaestuariivita atlantica]KNG94548.1 diaminopimelate epimerase [Pseudaestuariivita atlantica]
MTTDRAPGLPFMKMHGLGNDFVVLDARTGPVALSENQIVAIGDRHRGIGFDQLTVIEDRGNRLHLTFYNQDGSTAAACGNATRCVARHVMDEIGVDALTLTTERGTLQAQRAGDLISVNMGQPQLAWDEVPLAREMDTLELPIDGAPTATGMGNPHCTFFVDNAESIDLATRGAEIEHHPLYPERTNVQFAHLVGPDHLRMRVWERGVGVTLASGSSSCATAVAAARRGLTGRKVRIDLDGGTLWIDWRDDGVWMTGDTCHVASGTFTADFLNAHA